MNTKFLSTTTFRFVALITLTLNTHLSGATQVKVAGAAAPATMLELGSKISKTLEDEIQYESQPPSSCTESNETTADVNSPECETSKKVCFSDKQTVRKFKRNTIMEHQSELISGDRKEPKPILKNRLSKTVSGTQNNAEDVLKKALDQCTYRGYPIEKDSAEEALEVRNRKSKLDKALMECDNKDYVKGQFVVIEDKNKVEAYKILWAHGDYLGVKSCEKYARYLTKRSPVKEAIFNEEFSGFENLEVGHFARYVKDKTQHYVLVSEVNDIEYMVRCTKALGASGYQVDSHTPLVDVNPKELADLKGKWQIHYRQDAGSKFRTVKNTLCYKARREAGKVTMYGSKGKAQAAARKISYERSRK